MGYLILYFQFADGLFENQCKDFQTGLLCNSCGWYLKKKDGYSCAWIYIYIYIYIYDLMVTLSDVGHAP